MSPRTEPLLYTVRSNIEHVVRVINDLSIAEL
jgi:hypothetical protein